MTSKTLAELMANTLETPSVLVTSTKSTPVQTDGHTEKSVDVGTNGNVHDVVHITESQVIDAINDVFDYLRCWVGSDIEDNANFVYQQSLRGIRYTGEEI
jgi:hypothetical protein